MTKGTHLLRGALLALLALAVISGGSFAAGDLFDDDYKDCPTKTRLRDGQISDLAVARDSDEEDEVNVSWAATDPATWGLGPNAYSTSLVVLLDDGGDLEKQTLSLGSRKVTFDGVETGVEVKVQLAIVVDTADGDYLISDILGKSINQSLTEPSFMTTSLKRVTALDDGRTPDTNEFDEDDVAGGTLYYVGYNENFANYKANGLRTSPSTPRLRIGLAHGGENPDARDEVDFNAYIVRITDEDGDVVPEGDDVATVASSYGTRKLVFGTFAVVDGDGDGTPDTNLASNTTVFTNVRISDGDDIEDIQLAMHDQPVATDPFTRRPIPGVTPATAGVSFIAPVALAAGDVYAEPPDEHRDFPIHVFASDVTYTITAWAINDDREVISPVASLKVRPIDELTAITDIDDYFDDPASDDGPDEGVPSPDTDVILTKFTVLK